MRTEDLIKLKKAGYTILRAVDYPTFGIAAYNFTALTIEDELITDFACWQIIKRYDNKIDRDHDLMKKLENEKVILD